MTAVGAMNTYWLAITHCCPAGMVMCAPGAIYRYWLYSVIPPASYMPERVTALCACACPIKNSPRPVAAASL
ncbi:hypothetical protein D3C87_1787390 [compost metagenome]